MTCNFNTNNSNLSFGSISAVSGGKQFLEKALNKAERVELRKMIEAQKNNPVNVTIAHHIDKRLCGWTIFEEKTNGAYHREDYTQRVLFDSPLKFIKRLCDKADKLHEKYKGDIKESEFKQFELNI